VTALGFPSVTAQRVAAHRLGFERPATPYGAAAADDLLTRDVAGSAGLNPSDSMNRYLRGRTAFFDRTVIRALDRGVTQVVCIGAGYDGRSLRYAKPGVGWWEVDHPDTQADKLARLERLQIETPGITFVGFDLRSSGLAMALTNDGLAFQSPSLFLCEGVAVYLDAPVVESFVSELRSIAHADTRLAISSATASSSPDHAARRRRFRIAVARLGEPVRNSLTTGQMTELLARTGWRTTVESERAQRAGFLTAEPVGGGTRHLAPGPDGQIQRLPAR
jgi:methyltransferase (TIGR00027 family)